MTDTPHEAVPAQQYADAETGTDTTPTTDPTAELDADSPALTGDDE